MKYPNLEWGKMEAVVNKLGGIEGMEAFLRGETILAPSREKHLFDLRLTHWLPGTESFEIGSHFKEERRKRAEVYLYQPDAQFLISFGDKVEGPCEKAVLKVSRLLGAATDIDIIGRLVGQRPIVVRFSQIWRLLCSQGHGEAGTLLTNGQFNIFYVHDSQGKLHTIRVHWVNNESGFSGWSMVSQRIPREGSRSVGTQIIYD
ncbi:MAG TPA: hypothetical protein VG984_03670 [Candidatus Paceibacterota bacterium]|nr:hypothetical protein [Candidatus Paceibacterota bacterium]